jgi:hypothetical protein
MQISTICSVQKNWTFFPSKVLGTQPVYIQKLLHIQSKESTDNTRTVCNVAAPPRSSCKKQAPMFQPASPSGVGTIQNNNDYTDYSPDRRVFRKRKQLGFLNSSLRVPSNSLITSRQKGRFQLICVRTRCALCYDSTPTN